MKIRTLICSTLLAGTMGLGNIAGVALAIVAAMLGAHGGDITLIPSESGTEFRLSFRQPA